MVTPPRSRAVELKMSPRIEDDGGPSDEEGSSASEQIQQTSSNIIEPEEDDTSASEPESVENVQNPATDDNDSDSEKDEEDEDIHIADNSSDLAESETEEKETLDKSSDEPLPSYWQPASSQSNNSTPAKSGYESFGGKSLKLPTPFKHEDETPLDESPNKPKSRIASKAARGQVLVHYHPQLGDEGFESTLVEDPNNTVEISTPSRGRPMDESNFYTGGAAGMNSRMMEDVRVGRAYTNNNSQAPSSPMNDEQNNAATRQIRRRVFRAALERGLHDERRRKMLDADADIGGPSSRGDGAGINRAGSFDAYAAYSRQTTARAMNLTRSRDMDDDEGRIPISTDDIPASTPKSYDTSLVEDVTQTTISPPAPPTGPPSYRTIIQTLIANNEPEKLPQLEKVLAKYKGREEELILKLDLRYKKMKKKKSGAILQDLELSEKHKISVASRSSGEGRQSWGSHSGIKQTYSWDSRKSKDLYFVKVSSPARPLPGAIKLPSDIIESSKTAPQSNVRTVLAMEDEVDGDIPVINKRDHVTVKVSETRFKAVEKDEAAPTPVSQEAYKLKKTPSYGDGISVITMETKGTLKAKKNDRGEDIYTWQQRPPNSITVEGSKGSNGTVKESPSQAKINKLLPDYEREKEEDKLKANDADLGSTLDNVEARIRARRKIMEAEAKNKDDGTDDKNVIEKCIDGVSEVDGASLVVEDIDSFVGKPNSFVSAPADEREVQLSLIDQQDLLVETKPPESDAAEEEPATSKTSESTSPVGGDVGDDLDEEEEIDLLLKESRLQAEKAIALKKAQRELEKEKKARLEAEAAKIALEEELSRLKVGAGSDANPVVPQEEGVAEGDSEENGIDNTVGEKDDAPADSFKYDLNKTLSSVSDEKSRSSSDEMQGGDVDTTLLLEDNEQILSDQIDVTGASTELVGSYQNEVDADQGSPTVDDVGNGEALVADVVAPIPAEEETNDEVKETSESLQLRDNIVSPPSEEAGTIKVGGGIAQPSITNETHSNEHPEVPASPQDSSAEKSDSGEGTNINHVATTTFEGNRAKGQLSFITGARILAHSNQRGAWWLGRCGKQTGWFPANAVVPESEFLTNNISSALPAEMDGTNDGLSELSNEELAATYDLIRNPSDPGNDDNGGNEDNMNGSPARSRWLDDGSNQKSAQPSRSDSPPPNRSDPSKMEGLDQRLYESDESDAIAAAPQLGFEGMNRLGKSIEELSEDKPKKMYIGPPQAITEIETSEIEPTKVTQTRSGWQLKKKKKVQEWKAVKDPDTGLTYYYHVKTREVSCIVCMFLLYYIHFRCQILY